MPRTFSYDLSLVDSPAKAQARVREAVTEQVHQSAAMRPAADAPDAMAFRPQWGWPLLTAVTRRIRGEKIHLQFRATDLGTNVEVTGKVTGSAEAVASREFWARALTGRAVNSALIAVVLMTVYRTPQTHQPVGQAGLTYGALWTVVIAARAAFTYGPSDWFHHALGTWMTRHAVTTAAIVDGLSFMAVAMLLTRTIGLAIRARTVGAADRARLVRSAA